MMSNKQIRSIYNRYVVHHGEREAYEMFMDEYPDYEGELNLLILGQLEDTPAELEVKAPVIDMIDLVTEASDEDDPLDVTGLAEAADPDDEQEDPLDFPCAPAITKPLPPTKKAVEPAKKAVNPTKPVIVKVNKTTQAIALYKKAADKSRKAMIELFVKELNMTPAGAATYVSIVKKKVG